MNEMTSKERILCALKGQETDRTPWAPFLAYYWENLPETDRACGMVAYMQNMGADVLLRGMGSAWWVENRNCEISEKVVGNKNYHTWSTKYGSLTEVFTYSPNANSWFRTGHPVSTEEDFKVLQYLMENLVVHPNPEGFNAEYRNLGDKGVFVPSIGVHSKTAFQSLVEQWCGTEALTYALCDFPEVVEECLAVMQERDRETVLAAAQSSADVLNFFEDSSTTNISPAMFEKYTAPEINEWGRILHAENKLLLHHACGHLKNLIPLIAKTEIDVLESVSPPPTGNISIADCAKGIPEHIAIVGGIEPVFFQTCTMEELEHTVLDLLATMKGRRYVLANSDSCPPSVSYEKFRLVSDIVRRNNS